MMGRVWFISLGLAIFTCCASGAVAVKTDTPFGKADISVIWSGVPAEKKPEIKKQVCTTCLQLVQMRDTFQQLAQSAPDPTLRSSFQAQANAFGQIVQRCIEAQVILGECPHSP
jgi:hypothetical protein